MAEEPKTSSWDAPLHPAFQQVDWTVDMELVHVKTSVNATGCNEDEEVRDEDIVVPDVFTSLDEIIAGLFLSCEQAMCNRQYCQNRGIALVLTLNGQEHTAPYRVYEHSSELGRCIYRKIPSLDDFAAELDATTRLCLSETPPRQRKVFLRSVLADDMPTYDLSQHFTELCALIEIVLRNRRQLERKMVAGDDAQSTLTETAGGGDDAQPSGSRAWLPSVGVHCLAGVSRSTTVVAAYLMKRSKRPATEVLPFIRATRPIVSPNPGFYVQLEQWHAMKYTRIASEHDAALVAKDVRAGLGVDGYVHDLLPYILKAARCVNERSLFGFVLRRVGGTHVVRDAALYSTLLSIRQQVEEEVYADVPPFFAHVAQIFSSMVKYVPQVVGCVVDRAAALVSKLPGIAVPHLTGCWTDTLWWFTVMDFCVLSTKGEIIFAAEKMNAILNVVAAERALSLLSGSEGASNGGDVLLVSPPDGVVTSLPFLFMMAACAGDVVDGSPSSFSTPLLAPGDVQSAFLAKMHSGFGAVVASTALEGKRLTSRPLENDVEWQLFCCLTKGGSSKAQEILTRACVAVKSKVSEFKLTGRDAEACASCVRLKLISSILSTRLLFGAVSATRAAAGGEPLTDNSTRSVVDLLKELDRIWSEQTESAAPPYAFQSSAGAAILLLRAVDTPVCGTLATQLSEEAI